ncbi:MAG: VPLPA-CTERM sorting domain-containing protein [Gammaproteobacteria bacterium]|jgi:hypothetical protein|nr:VPLPA-CTERM sorting domain-containing protein [Gammaproteobacteria bacterium]
MRFLFATALLLLSISTQAATVSLSLDTLLTRGSETAALTLTLSGASVSAGAAEYDLSAIENLSVSGLVGGTLIDFSVSSASGTLEYLPGLDLYKAKFGFLAIQMSETVTGGGAETGWLFREILDGNNMPTMSLIPDNAASFEWSGTPAPGYTASVVPIPAAVWLFGSALAGLGWMRRK